MEGPWVGDGPIPGQEIYRAGPFPECSRLPGTRGVPLLEHA